MPTTNPRINVTLSPSLDALVGELAACNRVSKAAVLRELLEASEPTLVQVVAMMKAANELSLEARKRVSDDMQQALKSTEKKAAQAMALAAGITEDLVAKAEMIRGRRPPRKGPRPAGTVPGRKAAGKRKPARTPLSSNRGVKS